VEVFAYLGSGRHLSYGRLLGYEVSWFTTMCCLEPAALGRFGRNTSRLEKALEMARWALREPSNLREPIGREGARGRHVGTTPSIQVGRGSAEISAEG
jgi:hypothetical protein